MNARFLSSCVIKNSFAALVYCSKSVGAQGILAVALVAIITSATTGPAYAQENLTVEQLKKQLDEQRIALEEVIANRESTAAKAEEIKQKLLESGEQQRSAEEELTELCEEQEELKAGSLEECLSNLDS